MSQPDVRSFYAALGIETPDWATREAPVRCFANPDAHNHQDQHPSCSVNLHSGVFYCHGCGAGGGAYDAALTRGHSPRTAIKLMIAHGLTEPRTPDTTTAPGPHPVLHRPQAKLATASAPRAQFTINERHIQRWAQALADRPGLIDTLHRRRGWTFHAIVELELGLDALCHRITIPIRDEHGALQGLLRYDPSRDRQGPKMLAAPGTQLGLIPHPDQELSQRVLLVEGPPDMIAARSRGLAAIAVPGSSAWRSDWVTQLAGRHVSVTMDSDTPGRKAAKQIAADLQSHATVRVIDLAPARDDGYDLTDHLLAHQARPLRQPAAIAQQPSLDPLGPRLDTQPRLRAV